MTERQLADETDEALDVGLPTLEEVKRRLAATGACALPPWLTPEGLAALAAQGVPAINGPETMRLPDGD